MNWLKRLLGRGHKWIYADGGFYACRRCHFVKYGHFSSSEPRPDCGDPDSKGDHQIYFINRIRECLVPRCWVTQYRYGKEWVDPYALPWPKDDIK